MRTASEWVFRHAGGCLIDTPDLQGEVDRLRKAGVHFRNDIIVGLGGSEILLDDPSGNPIELFQPD